jgi:capsular polysaccharide transport system permease protein
MPDSKTSIPVTQPSNGTQSPLPAAPADQATSQAIPDLILTTHAVPTTLDKIRSRLSPTSKALLLAVLLPTFLSLLYFGLLASPMYIAEARFAVRGAETGGTATGLASLLLSSGTSVGADAHIVAEYIQSPDIMEAIDGELHIFQHFSSRDYDLISRLTANATRDERLSYWQWAVKPSFDPETGIIALSVKAYDPATAKKLAEAVLAKSEALVNAMSRRAQDDAITLAMSEVKTAEARVSRAQEAMRAFRDRSGMLDPASTAGGLQGIVSQLEGEVVKVRAEIAEASTYMSKNAPALVGLHARLAAVEKQLASEKLRLAGEARPDSLTSFAGEYEELKTESEFARQQLVSAMTSLETARVKAEAKSRYVVAFQTPALPDESLYPRPFLFTAYVLVGALVLMGLCSLIIAAVREHAGF